MKLGDAKFALFMFGSRLKSNQLANSFNSQCQSTGESVQMSVQFNYQ